MADYVNVRLCGNEAVKRFEENRDMFPVDRFDYNPSTGIVQMDNQDDALKLWKHLGYRYPKAMDIVAKSPEYEALMECYDGLSQADKEQIDFFSAPVGCRVSIHINSSRPDLQRLLWDAVYSVPIPDDGSPRSSRARSHEGLGNRLDERQKAIAYELGRWSMMVVTDDGTYVSDDYMRLIVEEQRRRTRTKHRINRKSSGRTQ